ncbi:MAG: UPF0175 family protein [Verrucomicrobiaceae bacterium]|nr:UPF0175 family protein [Verrucomicrobiaceae bacterium]
MTLTLPDMPMKEEDIRLELACALYSSRKLARGLAANLAGLDTDDFERELQRRGISNGCQPHDLADEVDALNQLLGR